MCLRLTALSTPSPLRPRIRPAITRPGGKSRLLAHLLPRIPADHVCYCEPFAGGLAVLLAKPRSRLEVVNDLDGDLVRFYRCVRFHPEALLTELEFVLNSREELRDFSAQQGLTDIQRAARWFHRNRTCFGGASLESFAVSATQPMSSRAARMESIRALNVRLDRVTVEHVSWERCVDLYDRPGTFFFCDPPYTDCQAGAYGAWTYADVQKLRDRLATIKGRWLLTLNDAPAIRTIFEGCDVRAVERARGIANRAGAGKAARYRELIIAPRLPK